LHAANEIGAAFGSGGSWLLQMASHWPPVNFPVREMMRQIAGCTIVRVRHLSDQSTATHSSARLALSATLVIRAILWPNSSRCFGAYFLQASTSIVQKPETSADMFHISGEFSSTLFDPHLARSYNHLVL
jgi:hypothetical protein